MTYVKTFAILGVAAGALYASPVLASDTKPAETTVTKTENTEVLAAVETANLIPVRNDKGEVFYNHYVPREDLHDVSIDHEVVDTYTYEYKGRLYTNKIVTQ